MPVPVSSSIPPPEDQFRLPSVQPQPQPQQTQTYNDAPDPAEYAAKPSRPTGAYAAPPVAPRSKPPAPPPSPVVAAAAACTPQQAYNAIKTIPVPNNADMAFLGYQAETAYADGARDYVSTYSASEGAVSQVTLQSNASGDSDYQTATWVIKRPDVNPASASLYAEATRLDMSGTLIDGSQDIQTAYTTAELFQLRQQARDWIVVQNGQDRLQQLEDGEFTHRAHPLEALAVAEGPHEIFNVLRSDDHALELIQEMYATSTDVAVPGTVRMQDSQ